MKIICVLTVLAFLLCGCSVLSKMEIFSQEQESDRAGMELIMTDIPDGEVVYKDGMLSDGTIIYQDGTLSNGMIIYQDGTLPDGAIIMFPDDFTEPVEEEVEDTEDYNPTEAPVCTEDTVPPVNDQSEIDRELVGKWQYVDTSEFSCILTIWDTGRIDEEWYWRQSDGQLSDSWSLRSTCRPTIEDGLITFPPDAEFDPPSLVLQLEYVEGVGHILRVVSCYSGTFTEYFHRVE